MLQTLYKFRRLTPLALIVAFWAVILVAALWDSVVMGLGCSIRKAPSHGIYARYPSAVGGASLTITTPTGSDCFVKLEREPGGIPVMSFFIHGGRPVYAVVPTGQFVMKVASGTTWCGESYLFGSGTTMQETGSCADGWKPADQRFARDRGACRYYDCELRDLGRGLLSERCQRFGLTNPNKEQYRT